MRRYQGLWEELKKLEKLTISVEVKYPDTVSSAASRIKKAVKKEKWLDSKYKKTHPHTNLAFYVTKNREREGKEDIATFDMEIVLMYNEQSITIVGEF